MRKPQEPLWNGFIQMVQKCEQPGQSLVIFMPMINMISNDESCISSTTDFVTEETRRYITYPILTFDRPLYWKGTEIQQSQDEANPLKEILVRLGGLHTSVNFFGIDQLTPMSFLGINRLMTSSGLQIML